MRIELVAAVVATLVASQALGQVKGREPTTTNASSSPALYRTVHVLAIGVEKYPASTTLSDLPVAIRDAKTVADLSTAIHVTPEIIPSPGELAHMF